MFEWNDNPKNVNDYFEKIQDNGFTLETNLSLFTEAKYMTRIIHSDFNHGMPILLETYNTEEEAKLGHTEWLKAINNNPVALLDVASNIVHAKTAYNDIKD